MQNQINQKILPGCNVNQLYFKNYDVDKAIAEFKDTLKNQLINIIDTHDFQ